MDTLVYDIKITICNIIPKITDLRHMSSVSKEMNEICEPIITSKEQYYINKYKGFRFSNLMNNYSIEKFTIEIVLDGYLKLLNENYFKNNTIICSALAFVGNLELLKYDYNKLYLNDKYMPLCASYNGHDHVLKWLDDNGYNFGVLFSSIADNAIYCDHLNIYDWLETKNINLVDEKFNIYSVMYYNSIKIANLLLDKNIIRQDHFDLIFKLDKPDILQLVISHKNIIININDHIDTINEYGPINILKFIKTNSYHINYNNIKLNNIVGDNAEGLQWCKDNNIILNDVLCENIIRNDKFDSFVWLYKNGYGVQKYLCKSNCVNIMQYCINNNLLTYCDIFYNSVKYCRSNVLEWILKLYKPNIIINDNFFDCIETVDYFKPKTVKLLYMQNLINKNIIIDNFKKYLHFDKYLIKKLLKDLLLLNVIEKNKKIIIKNDNFKYIMFTRGNNNIEIKDSVDMQNIIHNEINNKIYELHCDNKCWLYFYVLFSNAYDDVIQYAKKHICKCGIHGEIYL